MKIIQRMKTNDAERLPKQRKTLEMKLPLWSLPWELWIYGIIPWIAQMYCMETIQ